jgi:hypothetical protein
MAVPLARTQSVSKKGLWSGRILSGFIVLFFLFDSGIKLIKARPAVEGTVQLGYPADVIVPIGVVLLICTILYVIPRTALLGAVLLTGYLGGAVATNVRVSNPLFTHILFPVYCGAMVWGGLYLRDKRLREYFSQNTLERA